MDISVQRKSSAPPESAPVLTDHVDKYKVYLRSGRLVFIDSEYAPRFTRDFVELGDNWFPIQMVEAILGDAEEEKIYVSTR